MDVGTELKRARLQRGLSLQELANRTKISPPILRALEDNDEQRLPGGIFTRGFLKSYAREVGLNPQEIVEHYTAALAPPPPEPPEEHRSRRELRGTVELRLPQGTWPAARLIALAAIAVVYILFVGKWGPGQPGRSESPAARAAATPEARAASAPPERAGTVPSSPAAVPATAAVGSSEAPALPAGTSGTRLRVDLQPTKACWISVTADGRKVVYRLMAANDRESIEAADELLLRIGEPANVRVSINGAPAKLGPPGRPATVRITSENYRAFVE